MRGRPNSSRDRYLRRVVVGATSLGVTLCVSTTLSHAIPHTASARIVPPSCRGALRTAAASLPEIALDIDGDGTSDIITYTTSGGTTTFTSRASTAGTIRSTFAAAGSPVLGDYDGDGIADLAVVAQAGARLRWSIERSSSSELLTQLYGQRGDTALYGCSFIRPGYTSLAVVRGKRILAYDLASGDSRVFDFSELVGGEVIGCGDVTADGVDEPLLASPGSSPRYTTISAIGCDNEILTYRTLPAMTSQGIIKRPSLDFPLVIASRPSTGARSSIDPRSISDIFPTSRFMTPRRSSFSSGYFRNTTGELTPAVVWLEHTTGSVKRRLLTGITPTNEIVDTLPFGTKLVAPQGLIQP